MTVELKKSAKKVDKRKSKRLTKKQMEKIVREEFRKSYNKLKTMEKKFDVMIRKHDAKMHHFDKMKGVVRAQMNIYASKMDSIEDTFFTLYHNIKKNQFLYANEPEKWWKDYLDLKRHYQINNKKEVI